MGVTARTILLTTSSQAATLVSSVLSMSRRRSRPSEKAQNISDSFMGGAHKLFGLRPVQHSVKLSSNSLRLIYATYDNHLTKGVQVFRGSGSVHVIVPYVSNIFG